MRWFVLALAISVLGSCAALPSPVPDAAAARTSAAAPKVVLGLGDSVTSGSANDGPDYVTEYAQSDPAGSRAVNLGEAGLTASDLAGELATDADMRSAVPRADLILLTIGANDLGPLLQSWDADGCDGACQEPVIAAMGRDVGTVLGEVDSLRRPGARVAVTTYWNVFADGERALEDRGEDYLRWSDQVTRGADAEICRQARSHGALCVDLYTPFKGAAGTDDPTAHLAQDGDHPNRRGVALIVAALRQALAASH